MDRALFLAVNQHSVNPLADALLPVLTDGTINALVLAAVGLGLLLWAARRGRAELGWAARVVLVGALAVALGDLLGGQVLKPALARLRPPYVLPDVRLLVGVGPSFALPSNHAVNTGAVATAIALGYPRLGGWMLAYAALIAYSRVYVGVHWPSDVLVGLVLGWALAVLLWGVARRIGPRAGTTEGARG